MGSRTFQSDVRLHLGLARRAQSDVRTADFLSTSALAATRRQAVVLNAHSILLDWSCQGFAAQRPGNFIRLSTLVQAKWPGARQVIHRQRDQVFSRRNCHPRAADSPRGLGEDVVIEHPLSERHSSEAWAIEDAAVPTKTAIDFDGMKEAGHGTRGADGS